MREEGFRALYASYPTTVLMNVPNMAVHVATYESLKRLFAAAAAPARPPPSAASKSASPAPPTETSPLVLWCAGGGAGAIAGAVSTPLDVIKTRIQTYDPAAHGGAAVKPVALVKRIWKGTKQFSRCSFSSYSGRPSLILLLVVVDRTEEGWRAFSKGLSARVVYAIPSGAICWYELTDSAATAHPIGALTRLLCDDDRTTYEMVKRFLKA